VLGVGGAKGAIVRTVRSGRYPVLILSIVLSFLILHNTRGQEQTAQRSAAMPAVDRGLVARVYRAPDSPEARVRESIRSLNGPPERVGASGARYVAGKLIVKFRAGTSSTARVSALSATRARASEQPSSADFEIVNIDPTEDAEAAAAALAIRAGVEYAQPAYRVRAYFRPNDPLYSKQWNLPDIDMEHAWDIQPAAGSTITVAVLDTGVAYTSTTRSYRASTFRVDADGDVFVGGSSGTLYPALGNLSLSFVAAPDLGPSSRFVAPRDFIWDTTVPVDLDGHGTHVSGTIGQTTNNNMGVAGVAFNVKLMPVKVIDSDWDVIFGSPNTGTDDTVARGIRYAADNGAQVINMSIGRTGPARSAPVVEDAIRYAVGKGVFVAIAGGNGFEDGNETEVYAEIANRVQGAVSVAATDRNHNRAFYATTGGYLELAAPGGSFRGFGDEGGILQQTLDLDLVETFTSPPSRFIAPRFDAVAYFYFTGTSMATPHVAGVAAMLIQQGITSPAAIEAALEKFATDLGTPGRDDEFGFGEVQARNTLRGLGLAR
jgi:serine protease